MGLGRLPPSPPCPGVLYLPRQGRDQPPASCRWRGDAGRARQGQPASPPAPEDSPGTIAIVGHSCPLYPRLLGRDCSGRTLQSADVVDTVAPWSRDAEGRWEAEPGMGPPAPLVCLGVGRRVSCPPAGRGSAGDTPPPSTQVPSEPSPERWSRLCTGKAHPCPAPSGRHSLPFRPALTSRPQVQRALLALTIPLEALQAVKDRMIQAMRKGLSRQTHAQANVRMLPTYICSTPDGTGKAAQPGDVLLCYLQPCLPCWMWPRGCWGRVHWSPVSYWVHKLPLCCLCQSSVQGQRPGADSLGLCSGLRLSGASPVGE